MGKETYKLKVFCVNCNFKGEIEIPKGVAYKSQECPNCGVTGLERVLEPARLIPDIPNYF
ncbi:MAG: hypothetical protein HYT22_01360 [Candidatus Niyogibacteria bacterium]|nr:hypothetical protein [Candidatus Niyogibacteria bacterium]